MIGNVLQSNPVTTVLADDGDLSSRPELFGQTDHKLIHTNLTNNWAIVAVNQNVKAAKTTTNPISETNRDGANPLIGFSGIRSSITNRTTGTNPLNVA